MGRFGRGIYRKVAAKLSGSRAGQFVQRWLGKARHWAAEKLSLAARATAPKVVELKVLAKKGCKHCYGRGYTGKRVSDGAPIACKCVVVLGKLNGEIVQRYEDPITGKVSWGQPQPQQ